jgi:hypothetical protein
MASYPQIVEYNEVIQHPATAFVDPELQRGRVKENALGLPVVLSGGFALTYTITTPQRQLAVRCFHRQIPAADQKYASISKQVESLNSKYFVGFNYLKQGIKVKQALYPVVKMAWVEGDPLGIWLDKHSNNSGSIEKVRAEFVALSGFLYQHGIAHGDIQNGNVMISPAGITLIDYDGMYVPGMSTGNGSETGHKHFQHPNRETGHFGPTMDRFSFIALDLSLRAIAEDVSLHKKFREGGETIIFRANDFVDPSNSEVFQILRQRPRLKVFADNFAQICQAEIHAVPTLEDFLAGRNIPASKPISSRPAANGDLPASQPRTARYIGAYPVLSTGDYGGVLRMVGQRIELVGCIQTVKHGTGRRGKGRGKPYIFVNFGHWRGNIVKLTIWSEGLAQLSDWPDDRWIGRWVSVVGLVDAPYSGKHYDFHYTHVGITVDNPQQINVVAENQAKFRLGQMAPAFAWAGNAASKSDRRPSNGSSANRTIISGIAGKPAFNRPVAAPVRQVRPQGTTNQDILRGIRQAASAPPIQVPTRTSPAARRSGTPGQLPVSTSPNLLTRVLRLFGLSR